MDYHLFPSYLPNHSVVAAVASKVVQEWIRPFKANKRTLMDFRTVDAMSQPVTHVLTVPAQYALPIRQLVYRRFALAIMLHNARRLRIRPRRFWTTLAQNLLYVDDIWKRCLAKSDQSSHEIGKQALSDILDAYIITEAVVGRHEPVYVSAYRMKRRPEDPNISQTPFEDFDLSDYRETLACHPELSGRTYGSLIPCVPVGLSIVKKMLAEASEWYDDKERRVIWDPYTETWCEMGLEPHDPFDPRIEETEEEEGEIPNIPSTAAASRPLSQPSAPSTANLATSNDAPVAGPSNPNPPPMATRSSQKRERSGNDTSIESADVASATSPPQKKARKGRGKGRGRGKKKEGEGGGGGEGAKGKAKEVA
ncbi:hypothetical protein J3R83DRAFT_5776 [Lanmaoa asiatica]|nr:hypothetical protein J3R83DRAFT_5776 [Lanmaoa asiatica]